MFNCSKGWLLWLEEKVIPTNKCSFLYSIHFFKVITDVQVVEQRKKRLVQQSILKSRPADINSITPGPGQYGPRAICWLQTCPLARVEPRSVPLRIENRQCHSEIIWDPRTPKSIQNSAFSEIL